MTLSTKVVYLKRLLAARRHYRAGWTGCMTRFAHLSGEARYSPNEIFLLGLLDPALGASDLERFVSKERLLAVQRALNPVESFALTEDKVVFYTHCRRHGLATPRVFGVWGQGGGLPDDLEKASTLGEWQSLCRRLPQDEVVLKPVGGVHGQGVMLLRRAGDVFVDQDGRSFSSESLLQRMKSSDYATWLVQERLYGAPGLSELSGTDNLQTARVVTFVDRSGRASVLFAWLRVIGGVEAFDNFNFGEAGNFVATLDTNTATVRYALTRQREGFGLEEIEHHPVTGRPFAGFELPHGRAAFDLAIQAATHFAPLRTVGWDVAITPDGVALIEGNVTWDPLPTREDLGAVVKRLLAD